MNRTAKCIQLLMILKAHNCISSSQLADMIETNPRNIREYVRELEEAGYTIESVRGSGGGYRLNRSTLLPLPNFSSHQLEMLIQARDYIQGDPGFAFSLEVVRLLDQLIASSALKIEATTHFLQPSLAIVHQQEREKLQKLQQAIANQQIVEFPYQKREGKEAVVRKVNPYELICSEGRWYLLGYDRMRHDYRNFRISQQRMGKVHLCMDQFIRDPDFRLADHIGEHSLFRQSAEYYKVRVDKDSAHLFCEFDWGDGFRMIAQEEESVEYAFYSTSSRKTFRQLTRFGAGATLLSPPHRVREYVSELRGILTNYEESKQQ